jgi:hypothetical protein
MIVSPDSHLEALQQDWKARWPEALCTWSRFTKMIEPRWCFDRDQEKTEGLTDSFAMIRLHDHAVVISLRKVMELKLGPYAREILAHEIGHHVLAPGDLRDNARLITRVRRGLPTREAWSGFIANLYTDLIINDRLQRVSDLDMAGVYHKLKSLGAANSIWNLYQRIYEVLWNLPSGTLVKQELNEKIRIDAVLGARVVRTYARDWLDGAGRFAALFLPYLLEEITPDVMVVFSPWLDTQRAGQGDEMPDGLTEVEDNEQDGAIHPAEDDALTGMSGIDETDSEAPTEPLSGRNREKTGGRKNSYRDPGEFTDLMKGLGVNLPEKELVMNYYRERAIPHLIRFPTREMPEVSDPIPEGLDMWDATDPLDDLDWQKSTRLA